MCKFTPLGFETLGAFMDLLIDISSVNLPRWGLKLERIISITLLIKSVNLPRWGLKPQQQGNRVITSTV